jgi:UDP-N-acetylglucosamine--N-acetylmuramyl-(pentapeptide) pyrophosphoryl-undecaprenol N-acetylglucosamine transferase
MMADRIAILAAGGTAGHLFPAEALGVELAARGWQIHLVTDVRAERYSGHFPASMIHVFRSGAISGKNPAKIAVGLVGMLQGYAQSRRLYARNRPDLVVGFGGYPTVPPVLAAQHIGIPTMLHDANSAMGRANRLLARRSRLVAMGFEGEVGDKIVVTGNPVRPGVLDAARQPYPARAADEPFNLLVFGGSQGAQFFGDAVPAAIALLPQGQRERLRVVQQVRTEQMEEVAASYDKAGVEANTQPFFEDMPLRIAEAHLVICRAGASSVSELCVIGRPALLVPYPHALDHDQAANAAGLAGGGGAMLVVQSELIPEKLATIMKNAISDPEKLAEMAEMAKKAAKADAARHLADCAEAVADGRRPNQI